MADGTKIEWTDATWNPITGCSVVSPGCTNCYAMKLAGTRLKHHPTRTGLTTESKTGPVWNGQVRFNESMLLDPLKWRRPRMIFVCAHGDLFAENVPDEWIDQVFAVMALAPRHTFQVLTKRPERMRSYLTALPSRADAVAKWAAWHWGEQDPDALFELVSDAVKQPLPNVWLGVSVEDQKRAEERIPVLLETPAAVRWISAEPLLGAIDLTTIDVGDDSFVDALNIRLWGQEIENWRGTEPLWEESFLDWYNLDEMPDPESEILPRLDWVVAGGESGHKARPMHPDWARSLRDQCAAAEVPFLFKQWGEHTSAKGYPGGTPISHVFDDGFLMVKPGKRFAGRSLDGVEHNAFPQPIRPAPLQGDSPSEPMRGPVRSEAGTARDSVRSK